PQWFQDTYRQLQITDLGAHFVVAVNAWMRMEIASKFEEGDSLPKKGRPSALASWLRNVSAEPPSVAPKTFGKTFTTWRNGMQPSWQMKNPDASWRVDGEYGEQGREWHLLFAWGSGGVVAVLCGLYLW
ncbi:hypothetical protein C8F01DRAFT_949890, partial [Mycena amicta]